MYSVQSVWSPRSAPRRLLEATLRSTMSSTQSANKPNTCHVAICGAGRKQDNPRAPIEEAILQIPQDIDPVALRKRAVALYFGYMGTNYRGSQMTMDESQRDNPVKAVEDLVAFAIMKAGFMRKDNYGHPHKVSWTRSSRTDKGVHSLSTVVGLKMHCFDDSWAHDPEGLNYAAAINKHLPHDVRVFSVQRVSNSFDCRSMCIKRAYHYWVPATVLGMRFPQSHADHMHTDAVESSTSASAQEVNAGLSAEDIAHNEAVLARLREILPEFQGDRPFHNYTKRQRYIPGRNKPQRAYQRKRARSLDAPTTASGSTGDPVATPAEAEQPLNNKAAEERGTGSSEAAAVGSDQPEHGQEGEEEALGDDGAGGRGRGNPQAGVQDAAINVWQNCGQSDRARLVAEHGKYWQPFAFHCAWQKPVENDSRSRVFRAHFRKIYEFTASDVKLVGGVPAVRLHVFGESFMFNMIRHMVGMAVAVSRGALPLHYVNASLALASLCTAPLAPPHTLVLSANTFRKFKSSLKVQSPAVTASGDLLTLREGGVALRDEFEDKTLSAGLGKLLDPSLPSWRAWVDSLDLTAVDDSATQTWLQEFEEWSAAVAVKQAERTARKAAKAQAQAEGEGGARAVIKASAEQLHTAHKNDASVETSQGTVVAG